jgi:hypothetical protein
VNERRLRLRPEFLPQKRLSALDRESRGERLQLEARRPLGSGYFRTCGTFNRLRFLAGERAQAPGFSIPSTLRYLAEFGDLLVNP